MARIKQRAKRPQTLVEAIMYYSNEVRCVEFLSELKWKSTGEKCCIKCGSTRIVGMRTRPLFLCLEKECKKQFSIKKGTIMESSALPITKWVPAIWMIVNHKNGISSCELGRSLGVTQRTAWFMLHRIREAVCRGSLKKLSGEVEVDETFIGGKEQFKHRSKIPTSLRKRGQQGKVAVMGIVERGGEVRAKVVPNTKRSALEPEILKNVEVGSQVFTDTKMSYHKLKDYYYHQWVNHVKDQYVDGKTHTNTLENFWSLLKRSIKGTYIQIDGKHINRYVIEQAFRYNTRKETDAQRFERATEHIFGKRLKYKDLVGSKK